MCPTFGVQFKPQAVFLEKIKNYFSTPAGWPASFAFA